MTPSPTLIGRYLLLLATILLFSTCKKDDVIPAYIHIPAIDLVGNQNTFGSVSSKITDAWVYFEDGNLQGVYELPATFPIRNTGNVKLRIIAGIKVNGVAATRIIYPFFSDTLKTYNLEPGKTDTIRPKVTYFPSSQFALGPVDFETGNPLAGSEYVTSSDAFEGTSAKITPYDTTYEDFCISGSFKIPYNTSAAFLELNYKNDVQFTAGLFGYLANSNEPTNLVLVTMPPQGNWNKIYINMTNIVGGAQADRYQLYFYVKKNAPTDKHHVFLDNIKVIYF